MKSRTEEEMLELIVGTAKDDANIRVVVLEGSRANPNATKDPFQDYDVIYGVTDLKPYINNQDWIKRFGELLILQMPDGMGESLAFDYKFTYLMQFSDGNRIDLNLYKIESLKQHKFSSQSLILLDKEICLSLPPPSDTDYLPERPTERRYLESCNEFWWVAPYVAKGLWRVELGYARQMLDNILRPEAMKMMGWYFGIKTNFKVSPGKYGKYFDEHIEPKLCALLAKSYDSADIGKTWEALGNICSLFKIVGNKVGENFQYAYPIEEDRKINAYLQHVRELPRDAKQIY